MPARDEADQTVDELEILNEELLIIHGRITPAQQDGVSDYGWG